MMLMMVFVVSCTKPDVPNNSEIVNGQNDTIVDNGGTIDGHDYVDLGLSSGILWATCNVGADKPEDYGDYFAWGETEPKEIYDWKSYRYGRFFNERYELNKYCTDSALGLNGFVDDLTVLEPADDAATANWGANWRTPTIAEWEELFETVPNEWATQNSVEGWLFTASNGNSLFLPAVGYYWEGSFNQGLGIYWSSSVNMEFPYRAWGFHFNTDSSHLCGSSDRNRGQTVRAVHACQ
jgi:hypothetical protein